MSGHGTPETWDIEVDLVIGGTGAGGLTGAIVAHDEGLETIVLEKSTVIGGGAAVSDGEVWVPGSHVAVREGIDDPDNTIEEYLEHLRSNFPADLNLRKQWIVAARAAAQYLEERAGVNWMIIRGLSDVFYNIVPSASFEGRYLEVKPIHARELGEWKDKVLRSPHVPYFVTNQEMFKFGGASTLKDWPQDFLESRISQEVLCQGTGLIAYLLKAALDRKVPVYTDSPITRLICDEGAVIGVAARHDGQPLLIRARRGVLLNVGGYDWHPTYPYLFEQIPEWHSVMPPSIDGDLIVLAGEPGAAIIPYKIYWAMPGYHIPGEEWFGKDLYRQLMFEAGLPHSIVVNKEGRRFADESYFQDFGAKACLHDKTKGFVNYPCYIIFDENYHEKYPFGSIEPSRPYPDGFVKSANTVRELAMIMGIDGPKLEETVERFNRYSAEGVDKEYGRGSKAWCNQMVGDLRNKPNPNLGPIDRAPFFAIRLTFAGIGHNGGYLIDPEARVFSTRGQSIQGLYACGNCVAMTELGPTYQDGACLSRSIAFGYVAAKHAARSK